MLVLVPSPTGPETEALPLVSVVVAVAAMVVLVASCHDGADEPCADADGDVLLASSESEFDVNPTRRKRNVILLLAI